MTYPNRIYNTLTAEETKYRIGLQHQEETVELMAEALRWSDPPSRESYRLPQ